MWKRGGPESLARIGACVETAMRTVYVADLSLPSERAAAAFDHVGFIAYGISAMFDLPAHGIPRGVT